MVIEYLEGWLSGRGAKGIDSLAGKPGKHLSMMEDLATGRMSVAQIAQRILHNAKDTKTGEAHDFKLVKQLLHEELASIISLLEIDQFDTSIRLAFQERYRKATTIALRWIKNYTELNFRSLGSYTRTDLDDIANTTEAF